MKNKSLLPLALSLLITAIIVFLCHIIITFTPTSPEKKLDEGWHMTIGNEEYDNVRLSKLYETRSQRLTRNDFISLTITLPDLGELDTPAIIFQSRYTTVRCYLNDKELYNFGQKAFLSGDFTGKMYHIITLDPDYAGKELKINMIVAEENAFTYLTPVILGNHLDIAIEFANKNALVIATGIFVFIFGVSFLFIALVFVTFVPEVKSLLFSALFCMNLGAWLLSYYNILSLFIYTELETQLEYFTMYLIVPYCYLILYYIQDLKRNRMYITMMLISSAIPAIQYLLHYAFNIHLRTTLPIYHLDGLIGFLVICFYAHKNFKEKNISSLNKTQMTGLVFYSIAEVLHLVIYILDKMHFGTIEYANRIIICSGCIIFTLCQLSTYLMYITDSYARKQENASLSHLAYADGLTNLPNRAKADTIMDSLNNAEVDYCIVSIDLNGLKDVNDKFGHPTGDKYIKDFSKVLLNAFGNDGTCARIGGDEFLVILRDAGGKDITGMITRMNSALNVMNALYTEYKRSVASGAAFKHEFKDCTAHEVYLLADQRMYEEKRKMHEKLGIKTRL